MDTFEERMMGATAKEKEDAELLEQKYGCKVTRFGQALLPDEFRGYLRKYPIQLPLRWLSDLLVARPDLAQPTRRVNPYVDPAEGVKLARVRNYANPNAPLLDIPEWMWSVDSKTGRRDTPYWDLERSAHEAHRLQQPAQGLTNVYIWPDQSCSYVDDLPDEVLIEGPPPRPGRTPYWLVRKELTRSLDEVFGQGIASVDERDEKRNYYHPIDIVLPPPVPQHTPLTLTALNTWWRTIQYRIKTHGSTGSRVAALTNNLDKECVVTERETHVIVLRALAMFHYSALSQPDIELIEWAIKTEFQQECKVRLLSPEDLPDWDELPNEDEKEAS